MQQEGAITGRDEENLKKAKKNKKDKKKKSPTKQTVIGGSTKSDMSKDVVNQQAKNDSTKFVKDTGISEGKVPSVSDMYNASKHLSKERFDAMMSEIKKNNKKKPPTKQRAIKKQIAEPTIIPPQPKYDPQRVSIRRPAPGEFVAPIIEVINPRVPEERFGKFADIKKGPSRRSKVGKKLTKAANIFRKKGNKRSPDFK